MTQSGSLRNPTSQEPLPTSEAPRGLKSIQGISYFKFPEMGCLDSGWHLLAGNGNVGSLLPAMKSSYSLCDHDLDLRAHEGPLFPCPPLPAS